MTTTKKKKVVHGQHKTTAVKKGKKGRRKKARRTASGPADPPKPANASYRTLNTDPKHGREFEYQWQAGGCFNQSCTQRHITIISPANWAAQHVRIVTIPELPILRGLKLHVAVQPQFLGWFKAIVAKGLKSKITSYDGSFVPRTLTNKPSVRSNHAFGSAIDLNAKYNGYGQPQAPRGSTGSVAEIADFCADFGLYWGGWYSGNKDAMHFEAVRVLEAAELAAACQKHGVNSSTLPTSGFDPANVPIPKPRPPGL